MNRSRQADKERERIDDTEALPLPLAPFPPLETFNSN